MVRRALQVHGALGCTNEMPLAGLWAQVPLMGIMDGPSEVHRVTVARCAGGVRRMENLLADVRPMECGRNAR